LWLALAGLAVLIGPGCAPAPNPSFPLTVSDAEAALSEMSETPRPLQRPLVILAGSGDPGVADAHLARHLGRCIDDDRIIRVTFEGTDTFDQCRTRVIERIDDRFGGGTPGWTIEVDIVANSMGGLIARYASDPDAGERAVRIACLFTLAAPFLGADMAKFASFNRICADMQPGSEFLAELNRTDKVYDYELIPYARLGDTWVGLENTAPPGEVPWWVPNRPFEAAHLVAYSDPRIIADIARRLRGETPYATEPRAPLP
jgi:hypothetical protein